MIRLRQKVWVIGTLRGKPYLYSGTHTGDGQVSMVIFPDDAATLPISSERIFTNETEARAELARHVALAALAKKPP